MACTAIENNIYWIGGSDNTYIYNGIAYDGSGGVSPTNRILYINIDNIESEFNEIIVSEIPMDLRGITNVSETKKYIMGGMNANQQVTNKIYEITIDPVSSVNSVVSKATRLSVFPNPANDSIHLKSDAIGKVQVRITDMIGVEVIKKRINININSTLDIEFLPVGFYTLSFDDGLTLYHASFIIER